MALHSTLAGEYDRPLASLANALGLGPVADWEIADLTAPVDPRTDQRWHEYFVFAGPSLAQARAWLPLLSEMGKARMVILLIKESRGVGRQMQQTPGLLAVRHEEEGVPAPEGYTAVRISGAKWVDVHDAVQAALLRHCVGRRTLPLRGTRVGLTRPVHGPWACGDGQARLMTPKLLNPDDTDIFPVDFILAERPLKISGPRQPSGVIDVSSGGNDTSGWSVSLPPVDTAVISPTGFLPYPRLGTAVAEVRADGAFVVRSELTGELLGVKRAGAVVGEDLISALRNHSYLEIRGQDPGAECERLELATALAALAVAGVPMLNADGVGGSGLLGSDLRMTMASFDAADSAVVRESKSINMRRVALEYFSPSSRWGHWAADFGRSRPETTLVSVVLATRRPDRIRAAVAQIARQSWPNVEIILALHGIDVPEAELAVLNECGRPVTVRRIPADRVLGEVLNAGVEASSGQLIAKMDDDDWYGRNHLLDLIQAREYSGAQLVGSQVEFVYLEDLDLVTRRPPEGERYTNHVAGGTMMISAADLAEVGGWRPVHRAVDRCLLQSVKAAGGSIYRGHGQNYVMHRYSENLQHGGHTWAPENEVFLQNSAEQWNGFVLPPQLHPSGVEYEPPGRASNLRSIFQ